MKCLPVRVYRIIDLPDDFQEMRHDCQDSNQEVVYWSTS